MRQGCRRCRLLADDLPQTFCGWLNVVDRERVKTARPIPPRSAPFALRQSLQMPAYRGLRQLHDIAEFRHGQLAAFKNGEHPDSNRVRQNSKLIDDCGSFHPSIRMKE